MNGERDQVRTQETNLGDLIADAMLKKAGCVNAQIAIVNSGGIRKSIKAGDITLLNVMEVLPFNNYLQCVDLTGEQIIACLENGVSQVEKVAGRFPQVAGLRFNWDPSQPAGKRVVSVEVLTAFGSKPIDMQATYRVATNDFMVQGGDDYTAMKSGSNINNLGFMLYEVVADYMKTNSPINYSVENRITRLQQ